MKQVILASESPRRKKLLEQIGLSIKVVPSNFDEKLNPRLKPRTQAEQLSLEKAKVIAQKYPDAIILAADTLVVSGEDIIGKPKNLEDAKRILKKLQGKQHQVVTGFTIMHPISKKIVTDSEVTYVTCRKLTDKEIKKYIQKENPLDKAGGYGIQGMGVVLVEKINGDFSNVVGLPLSKIIPALKKFGIEVL